MEKVGKRTNTKLLVTVSLLGVISFLLMLVRFPLPFAPSFMDLDISEMPALLASFSMGPGAGFLVIAIKEILKVLAGSETIYVGELSNLIVSSALVIPAGLIYQRSKTKKQAIISLVVGVIAMSLVATLSNYFFIFPLYGKLMGISMQDFASAVSKTNVLVSDFKSLMVFAVLPFNIVKGGLTSFITFLLYKKVKPILHL